MSLFDSTQTGWRRLRRRPGQSVAVPLMLVSLCGAGCRSAPPSSVVLVVIDTLRPDHLGVYGYGRPTSPNLDRMAADAAVFERAVSNSTWTLPAFGSLYTGHLPSRHGAGVMIRDPRLQEAAGEVIEEHGERAFTPLDPKLPTLAQVLRGAGYETAAIVNNAFLDPRFGLSRGFTTYDYRKWRPERGAPRAVELALEWLDDHRQRPVFLVVHFMDVHMPYDPHESIRRRFGADASQIPDARNIRALRGRIARGNQLARSIYTSAYDEEVAFVDEQLGALLAGIREHGLWDESLMIVTSDHGEAFFEHGRWEHGSSVFDEVTRIPFLVRGPGVRAGRSTVPISLLDVTPTVMDAVGVAVDEEFEGVLLWPMLTGGAAPADRELLIEGTLYGAEQKAIIQWPYKVVYQTGPPAALLFDLEADPGEMVDLSMLQPERLDDMMSRLREALVTAVQERSTTQGVTLDPVLMETLRTLGYLK